ncbi:MAG: hypothetical protein A3K68_05705 [Euryarchaeota archaeon RBG_16_68_13]|nr:MAG: hypothetical protein A3K68_05705 [Euryarchaeota archaeon RBG_16_68_13]
MALGSPEAEPAFNVRACGILVHGDAVLMEETRAPSGAVAYNLPGGRLRFGESLALCLSREFYEETGLNVEPDKLVYVHEYLWSNVAGRVHEIGFYFLVDLSSGFPSVDERGYLPAREGENRFRLVPLSRLREHRVLPEFLLDVLPGDARESFAHPTRHLATREV